MADTVVTGDAVRKLRLNTASEPTPGVAVSSGDTAVLTPVAGQVAFTNEDSKGAQFDADNTVVVLSTAGSAATVTVEGGVTGGTPASRAVYGDLELSLGANQRRYVSLELSRFAQADGTVRLAVAGGAVTVSLVVLGDHSG